MRRAEPAQTQMRHLAQVLFQRGAETGLTDTRLARQQQGGDVAAQGRMQIRIHRSGIAPERAGEEGVEMFVTQRIGFDRIRHLRPVDARKRADRQILDPAYADAHEAVDDTAQQVMRQQVLQCDEQASHFFFDFRVRRSRRCDADLPRGR